MSYETVDCGDCHNKRTVLNSKNLHKYLAQVEILKISRIIYIKTERNSKNCERKSYIHINVE
jgi:hypothetical protein